MFLGILPTCSPDSFSLDVFDSTGGIITRSGREIVQFWKKTRREEGRSSCVAWWLLEEEEKTRNLTTSYCLKVVFANKTSPRLVSKAFFARKFFCLILFLVLEPPVEWIGMSWVCLPSSFPLLLNFCYAQVEEEVSSHQISVVLLDLGFGGNLLEEMLWNGGGERSE